MHSGMQQVFGELFNAARASASNIKGTRVVNENISDEELVAEFFERISSDDEDAALDLAQFYMARVVKKDAEAMLHVIEGLARASAARGSAHAKAFLEENWAGLRPILLRRLRQLLGETPANGGE